MKRILVRISFYLLLIVFLFITACSDEVDDINTPLSGLPDDLTTEQFDILNVVHNIAYLTLYKNAGCYQIKSDLSGRENVSPTNFTINGSEGGNATIVNEKDYGINPDCVYPQKSTITFNNYKVNGITVNGSFWWYTGVDYKDLDAPPVRRACFIYVGGGDGGTLTITGKYDKTLVISTDFINMIKMNNTDYWDDNALVIEYNIDDRKIPIKTEMLANAYRKTFKKAFDDLVTTDTGTSPTIVVNGAQGGTAVWSVVTNDAGGGNTRRIETITFNNYADNNIIINDSFSFESVHVTGDVANIVSGGDFIGFTTITGYRNGIAQHSVNVYKPSSIWNFSITYYVEELSFQFVFIRLGMNFGG